MSAAKLQRTAKNGTSAGTNGIRKRSKLVSSVGPIEQLSPNPQELARFAIVKPEPSDTPMWPAHPVIWLQPDLRPALPSSSGLSIERHLRIPAPDFLNPGITPVSRVQTLDTGRDDLRPEVAFPAPQSGLEPLGWDPREHCRKGGSQ